jgi:hypothetical protein
LWVSSRARSRRTTRINRTAWGHSTSRSHSTSEGGRASHRARVLRTLRLKRRHFLLTSHRTARHASLRNIVCDRASSLADNLPPLVRSLRCMRLERNLMANGEAVAQLTLRHILALDVELLAANSTNHAVRKIERKFWDWVLCKVVVRLELVQELGGRNDVVVCVVRAHDLALALERARDEGLRRAVVLVGELDLRDGARGGGGVDEDGVVALDEAVPLEVEGDALRVADHVAVRGFGMLLLSSHNLQELCHAVLHGLDDVCFKLCKRVLHTDQVLSVGVLFLDLLVQAVHDTALQDVGVICGFDVSGVGVEGRSVGAEKFNVFLGVGSRLVDGLAALAGALGQLLALVLDLGVEAVENGEDGALELFCGLVVLVGDALVVLAESITQYWDTYLCVGPYILEHARDTTQRLIEVMALLQRVLNRLSYISINSVRPPRSKYLQHPLILLAVRMVRLLRSGDIVLEVCDCVLPSRQPLREELRDLS